MRLGLPLVTSALLSLALVSACGSSEPAASPPATTSEGEESAPAEAADEARDEARNEALNEEDPGPMRAAPAEESAGQAGPWWRELDLEEGAYRVEGAPNVIVHAPPAFDPSEPLRLAVFLHGWTGCARVLARDGEVSCRDGDAPRPGWGLAERVASTGTGALFVVPQLAFLERNGDAGAFGEEAGFARFITALLSALEVEIGSARIESIALFAHSAGFETALAIIERGGVEEVSSVVLFDALYAGWDRFAAWVAGAEERRLVSIHTRGSRPERHGAYLVGRAALGEQARSVSEGPLEPWIRQHRLVVAPTRFGHGQVPARHLPEVLRGLGLAGAPTEGERSE